jgi:hypothetical protein
LEVGLRPKKRSPNIPASPPPETNFSLRPWGGRKIHKFALGAEMASYGPARNRSFLPPPRFTDAAVNDESTMGLAVSLLHAFLLNKAGPNGSNLKIQQS